MAAWVTGAETCPAREAWRHFDRCPSDSGRGRRPGRARGCEQVAVFRSGVGVVPSVGAGVRWNRGRRRCQRLTSGGRLLQPRIQPARDPRFVLMAVGPLGHVRCLG